jgi:hypothetical protein
VNAAPWAKGRQSTDKTSRSRRVSSRSLFIAALQVALPVLNFSFDVVDSISHFITSLIAAAVTERNHIRFS